MIIKFYEEGDKKIIRDELRFISKRQPKDFKLIMNKLNFLEREGMNLLNTNAIKKISSKDHIFEVKANQYRLLFYNHNPQESVILVLFLKKTVKTPEEYKELAIKRKEKYLKSIRIN